MYQMLTGTLPFAAADPLEWVHCHIARQPIPPLNAPRSPAAVDDRHEAARQNARSATRCSRLGAIFGGPGAKGSRMAASCVPAGREDARTVPDSEKLYGRERESKPARVLRAGRAEGATELVLGRVLGSANLVVNELHKRARPVARFFASGKFDSTSATSRTRPGHRHSRCSSARSSPRATQRYPGAAG